MTLLARVILILFLALAPVLGVEIYNDVALRRAAEQQARDGALLEARFLTTELDGLLTGVRNALVVLAGFPVIQSGDSVACHEILRRSLSLVGMEGTLTLAGPDGRWVCSGIMPTPGANDFSDQPHFRLPIARRDFAIGGFFVDRSTGTPQLGLGYPVLAPDGTLRGVLMVGLELNWLRDTIAAKTLPAGSSVTIADRAGRFLVRLPDDRLVGQPMPDEYRWMLQAQSEDVTEGVETDGVRRIVGFFPFTQPPDDLFVSVGFSTDSAYATSRAAASRAYGLTALSFALAMLVAVLAARRSIAGPVGGMLDAVDRWRGGAREVTVPVPPGSGEMAAIARALNELIGAAGRNEASLRRRLGEISALFESAPAGLGLMDRELRFISLNERLAQINGRSVEAHLGRRLRDVVPAMAVRLEPLLQEIIRGGHGRYEVELTGATQNGADDRSWIVGWHPVRDADGTVESIAVAVLETTALRAAEAALRASEARLALAQDAVGMGTFDWNTVTGELRWSAQQYELHGLRPVAGEVGPSYQSWVAAVLPEDRLLAQAADGAARGGRTTYSSEYRVRDPATGAIRWIATRARIFADPEGRPLRVVGVNYEITERRAAESAMAQANAMLERRVAERTAQLEAEMSDRRKVQAELLQSQKMEALGQLTGGIAHDFNNLLTAVTGNLELALRRAGGNPDLSRFLEGGLRAADRGAALTRRMLSFARRQIPHPVPVDLAALVAGMENLLARTIGPGVRVVTDVPAGLAPVRADPTQLELAVLNLAINARDAMPRGGTLTISAVEETEGGDAGAGGRCVRLVVADTGTGMDPQTAARAFEPFFTTKETGRGTGLGLSMVQDIVRQLSGSAHIDSTPGVGTRVTMRLPHAAPEAPERPAPPAAPAPARFENVAVLLVDDDADVVSFTAECLEDAGCLVLQATDGEAALTLLRGGARADVLIADLSMPDMTGAELAGRARDLRPDLPVLLATGYADLDLPQAGALPVLQKPYRGEQLRAAVAALLGGRNPS